MDSPIEEELEALGKRLIEINMASSMLRTQDGNIKIEWTEEGLPMIYELWRILVAIHVPFNLTIKQFGMLSALALFEGHMEGWSVEDSDDLSDGIR